ncbi:MAG: hypothetical protein MHM6MM_003407 [Cercozoa sp. M6MM]
MSADNTGLPVVRGTISQPPTALSKSIPMVLPTAMKNAPGTGTTCKSKGGLLSKVKRSGQAALAPQPKANAQLLRAAHLQQLAQQRMKQQKHTESAPPSGKSTSIGSSTSRDSKATSINSGGETATRSRENTKSPALDTEKKSNTHALLERIKQLESENAKLRASGSASSKPELKLERCSTQVQQQQKVVEQLERRMVEQESRNALQMLQMRHQLSRLESFLREASLRGGKLPDCEMLEASSLDTAFRAGHPSDLAPKELQRRVHAQRVQLQQRLLQHLHNTQQQQIEATQLFEGCRRSGRKRARVNYNEESAHRHLHARVQSLPPCKMYEVAAAQQQQQQQHQQQQQQQQQQRLETLQRKREFSSSSGGSSSRSRMPSAKRRRTRDVLMIQPSAMSLTLCRLMKLNGNTSPESALVNSDMYEMMVNSMGDKLAETRKQFNKFPARLTQQGFFVRAEKSGTRHYYYLDLDFYEQWIAKRAQMEEAVRRVSSPPMTPNPMQLHAAVDLDKIMPTSLPQLPSRKSQRQTRRSARLYTDDDEQIEESGSPDNVDDEDALNLNSIEGDDEDDSDVEEEADEEEGDDPEYVMHRHMLDAANAEEI